MTKEKIQDPLVTVLNEIRGTKYMVGALIAVILVICAYTFNKVEKNQMSIFAHSQKIAIIESKEDAYMVREVGIIKRIEKIENVLFER